MTLTMRFDGTNHSLSHEVPTVDLWSSIQCRHSLPTILFDENRIKQHDPACAYARAFGHGGDTLGAPLSVLRYSLA